MNNNNPSVFQILFFMWIGLLIGNYMGDSLTMKDCAEKSEAKMMSGGIVKCEVARVSK